MEALLELAELSCFIFFGLSVSILVMMAPVYIVALVVLLVIKFLEFIKEKVNGKI